MKWITPVYKKGDQRTIKKFLWLPYKIENETRWLEFAEIRQEYICIRQFGGFWEDMGFTGKGGQVLLTRQQRVDQIINSMRGLDLKDPPFPVKKDENGKPQIGGPEYRKEYAG